MVDIGKPRKFSLTYRITRFMIDLVATPFIRKISGAENLLREGPYIIALNHASHIDWLFFINRFNRMVDKPTHIFTTTKYSRNPFFKFYVEQSQCIWMDPRKPALSMYTALEYLKRGDIVGIFPEGTRSPDGKIKKGKTGIAALVLQAKVPVIPVGLIGTEKVLPRGAALPRFARCEANVGNLIKFDAFYQDYDDAINRDDKVKVAEVQEKVVAIIMKEIARLSNQEYPF